MLATASSLHQSFVWRKNKIHKFNPKVEIYFDFGPYTLKTADTREELIEAFKLRHEIFVIGMRKTKTFSGLDLDQFDNQCDHLIIVHRLTNKIVGTYRLNSSLFNQEFYSAQEFNLARILSNRGPYLELGRACIAKEHRKGAVISMLWRGIAEYMEKTNSNIVFGCSSVKTTNARESALIYKYFIEKNAINEDYLSYPTKKYKMDGIDLWSNFYRMPLSPAQIEEAESIIPPLLKSYIKLGATIAGEPAFDKDYNCIDFLTVLERSKMSHLIQRKYKIAVG